MFALLLSSFLVLVASQARADDGGTCTIQNVDLVILLSQSVVQQDENAVTSTFTALATFVDDSIPLEGDGGNARVAFITFNETGNVQFNLSEYSTHEDASDALYLVHDQLYGTGDENDLGAGFRAARLLFIASPPSNRKRLVLLLTDQITGKNTSEEADALKANDIHLYSVAIESINAYQALQSASDGTTYVPAWSQTFPTDTFASMLCDFLTSSVQTTVATTQLPHHSTPSCPCTASKAWLDITFILDTSAGVSADGFQLLRAVVGNALTNVTISLTTLQSVRVALIGMDKTATVYGNLTSYRNKAELNAAIRGLPTNGTSNVGVALLDALNAAKTVISETSRQTQGVQQVIVVVTSAPVNCSAPDEPTSKACVAAATMLSTGINIFTVTVQSANQQEWPVVYLGEGSLGFNGSSPTFASQIEQALCNANCFCLNGQTGDIVGQVTQRGSGAKYSECVVYPESRTTFTLADAACRAENTTMLSIYDQDKQNFVTDFRVKKGFTYGYWTGLGGATGAMSWTNGEPLLPNDYQNWAVYPPVDGKLYYAYAEVSGLGSEKWKSVLQSTVVRYDAVCQRPACSTDNIDCLRVCADPSLDCT